MALTATQRQQNKRDRDKKTEAERLALIRGMARMGIEEPQDYISRLIHNDDLLSDNDLERMTRLQASAFFYAPLIDARTL